MADTPGAMKLLPPEHKVEPYAVEQYTGVAGIAILVVRDGRGDVMAEARMRPHLCTDDTIQRFQRWAKEYDARAEQTLRILP